MNRFTTHQLAPALLATLLLTACGGSDSAPSGDSSAATIAAQAKPLTSKNDLPTGKAVVWTPLIDATMSQWRAWKSDVMPSGWIVSGDSISKDSIVADIQTRTLYANFELEFDWKVGSMANAGVFYRVTEEYDKPYWSAPEYQLRDEALDPQQKNMLLASASAYGVVAPTRIATKPPGEWNSARIVVAGNFVEHWLNGEQVVQYQLRSPEWTATVKGTKFAAYPNYGLASRGFISIQGDHSGKLSIRGMRIRELP
jgi:hypothetical protein